MSVAAPWVTVVVPARDPRPRALSSLCRSLSEQHLSEHEVIVVDDGSAAPVPLPPDDPRARVVALPAARGPATARNVGAAAARGQVLFFTDCDCRLAPGTLSAAVASCRDGVLSAGNTVTVSRTRFGAAVALLGFPGGGSLGFPRVWRVGVDGSTHSASACNLAVTRRDFHRLGAFDASFPVAGGEDTVLARTAVKRGLQIRYTPEQLVFHAERGGPLEFVHWQLTRGRGSFHIRRRLGSLRGFVRLRRWSFGNSLRAASPGQAPLVLTLIGAFFLLHAVGFGWEAVRTAISDEAPATPDEDRLPRPAATR